MLGTPLPFLRQRLPISPEEGTFLERSNAHPAPEDCGLWSEGHGDLVLLDRHKLGTCPGHAALSLNDGPEIKI